MDLRVALHLTQLRPLMSPVTEACRLRVLGYPRPSAKGRKTCICVLGSVVGRIYHVNSGTWDEERACGTCQKKQRPCVIQVEGGHVFGVLPLAGADGLPVEDVARYIQQR